MTFRVYTAAIQSHFEPGGAVFTNAQQVGDQAVTNAKLLAPVRTGVLKASIRKFGRGVSSNLGYTITVVAYAPYGLFVEEGTVTPITPWSKPYLLVPISRGARRRIPMQYVRGQRAQHYLRNGMDASLRFHGYGGVLGDSL